MLTLASTRRPALLSLSLAATVAWAPLAQAADPVDASAPASAGLDPAAAASWRIDVDMTEQWDATSDLPPPGPEATAAPTAVAPQVDTPAPDPAVTAERARIVGKGRGLITAGTIFSGIAVVGLIATAVFSVRGNTGGAIGAAGGSLLFAGTGLALVVPGKRRVKNPERYMKTPRVALGVTPILSRHVQGAGVSVRF